VVALAGRSRDGLNALQVIDTLTQQLQNPKPVPPPTKPVKP
jgi:hypothetical protein